MSHFTAAQVAQQADSMYRKNLSEHTLLSVVKVGKTVDPAYNRTVWEVVTKRETLSLDKQRVIHEHEMRTIFIEYRVGKKFCLWPLVFEEQEFDAPIRDITKQETAILNAVFPKE